MTTLQMVLALVGLITFLVVAVAINEGKLTWKWVLWSLAAVGIFAVSVAIVIGVTYALKM